MLRYADPRPSPQARTALWRRLRRHLLRIPYGVFVPAARRPDSRRLFGDFARRGHPRAPRRDRGIRVLRRPFDGGASASRGCGIARCAHDAQRRRPHRRSAFGVGAAGVRPNAHRACGCVAIRRIIGSSGHCRSRARSAHRRRQRPRLRRVTERVDRNQRRPLRSRPSPARHARHPSRCEPQWKASVGLRRRRRPHVNRVFRQRRPADARSRTRRGSP